jgi:hypothetical protein
MKVTPWPTSQWDDAGGAGGDVVHRVAALDLPHDRDGLLEHVRRVLARAVGGERLVEVDVRLDERTAS